MALLLGEEGGRLVPAPPPAPDLVPALAEALERRVVVAARRGDTLAADDLGLAAEAANGVAAEGNAGADPPAAAAAGGLIAGAEVAALLEPELAAAPGAGAVAVTTLEGVGASAPAGVEGGVGVAMAQEVRG